MVEHQGIAPCIPVWKTGVYLSTPMLEEMAGCRVQCAGEFSERSLKVRRLLREQEQGGALPPALTILRDANTGAGWGFTDPAAAVQLRLRVAVGLQALQRCSGFLNRRARGSTVATHHFMPAWLSSDSSSFVNCRAIRPTRVRVSPSAPFHAPVAQNIRVRRFERRGCR